MHKTFVKLGRAADFKTSGSRAQDVEVEVSALVQALARCQMTCQCVPVCASVCQCGDACVCAMRFFVAWGL